MNSSVVRQIATVFSVIITIAFNILANALPLNGLNTGEISDRFDVYFVPAGYVFSIWGLIYIGLLAFAFYQALPAQRLHPRLVRVGYLFALTGLANIGWLLLWHYEKFVLAPSALIALTVLLIGVYQRLEIGRAAVGGGERWCLQVPTSIYLGWATVATIANVTTTLYFLGWGGWGLAPAAWAAVMVGVATVIGVMVFLTRRDFAFVLVLIWALAGVAIKHSAEPLVMGAAWLMTAVLGMMLLVGLVRRPVAG